MKDIEHVNKLKKQVAEQSKTIEELKQFNNQAISNLKGWNKEYQDKNTAQAERIKQLQQQIEKLKSELTRIEKVSEYDNKYSNKTFDYFNDKYPNEMFALHKEVIDD
ncbi:hypothetical protein LCGC14_0667160 [marine sediment metagenome]|uniref:Uncharacterized protein n=1 Tax=marine sediment metagenome TaxID=412755 RepID=A0A0F9QX34_9ZZZZ